MKKGNSCEILRSVERRNREIKNFPGYQNIFRNQKKRDLCNKKIKNPPAKLITFFIFFKIYIDK